MTKDEELQRAAEAAQVLNNPIFQESFRKVREALIIKLEEGKVPSVEYQRDLVICLKMLAQVKRLLEEYVQTGRMAEETLYPTAGEMS